MNQVRNPDNLPRPDLIVIGAGIFGLWAARRALKRGERVLVLEKREVGAGASGGFLGALMPHMPDSWNAKKQMQFDGLSTLADAIAELEADTGHDCGYRRCGRLMPIRHEKLLAQVERRIEGANRNWADGAGRRAFEMEHIPPEDLAKRFAGPEGQPWLAPDLAVFGAQYDTLSARVNPRACLAALAAFARRHASGEIREGAEVVSVAEKDGGVDVTRADGTRLAGGRAVIANGWEAYSLLAGMKAKKGDQPLSGRGVKGQAVLVGLEHDDTLPIVYDDGSYVVPHAGGKVGVGSTSVNEWMGEAVSAEGKQGGEAARIEAAISRYDPDDTGFYDHALALCPALAGAPITERWANVRPRNTVPDPLTGKVGTDPVFGPLDGAERISVAVGGFKISFGLAHLDV